jgi:hypothetical protein
MHAQVGQRLTKAQLQQLQWVVPTPFDARFVEFFLTNAAAGAKVKVTLDGKEHWLGMFDLERMVDEALRSLESTSVRFPGLIPFAGCGRRSTLLYLVDVTDGSVWCSESGKDPASLGIVLSELWSNATIEPRVSLRRRLPVPRVSQRPAAASKPFNRKVETSCKRTLWLFPVQP